MAGSENGPTTARSESRLNAIEASVKTMISPVALAMPAFSAVALPLRCVSRLLPDQIDSAVCRSVRHENHLQEFARIVERRRVGDLVNDACRFVVDRNDHRYRR
jgi:hypothetical protein